MYQHVVSSGSAAPLHRAGVALLPPLHVVADVAGVGGGVPLVGPGVVQLRAAIDDIERRAVLVGLAGADDARADGRERAARVAGAGGVRLGFGRTVVSEIEIPNMFVTLV